MEIVDLMMAKIVRELVEKEQQKENKKLFALNRRRVKWKKQAGLAIHYYQWQQEQRKRNVPNGPPTSGEKL